MTAILANDGSGWSVLEADGFEKEERLHTSKRHLAACRSQARPGWSSGPGSHVRLWQSGPARHRGCGATSRDRDQLAQNPEARRAVVAQVLRYASFLKGLSVDEFDERLAPHLAKRGSTATTVGWHRAESVHSSSHQEFMASIATAPIAIRAELERLAHWAVQLEKDGLATLYNSTGVGQLSVDFVATGEGHDSGLTAVWNDNGASSPSTDGVRADASDYSRRPKRRRDPPRQLVEATIQRRSRDSARSVRGGHRKEARRRVAVDSDRRTERAPRTRTAGDQKARRTARSGRRPAA